MARECTRTLCGSRKVFNGHRPSVLVFDKRYMLGYGNQECGSGRGCFSSNFDKRISGSRLSDSHYCVVLGLQRHQSLSPRQTL